MAVTSLEVSKALSLRINKGTNDDGKTVYGTMTFKNIKLDAADEDVYDVAKGIEGLLEYAVDTISKQEVTDLIGQA